MANYKQVSYGSQGSDVTELQKLLNQNGGYNLSVDGIYGKNTDAAVRDWQKKSGLAVDGIVGTNTWGSLTSVKPSQNTGATGTAQAPASDGFQYADYQESDTVKQAQEMLNQQLQQKPGEYQSTWKDQLNETISQILNRDKFSYDLNGDALYQQYKDQYVQQGKMAMMDTMGQAQAMTGGYGNSYAQSVGQQAYQGYLQQLNEVVPELYGMALDQYNQEGQDMYNQAALMAQMEDQDYGRYQDAMNAWLAERDYLAGRYDSERNEDFTINANNKRDIINLIASTGYKPTDDELASIGMTRAQADSYAKAYTDSKKSTGTSVKTEPTQYKDLDLDKAQTSFDSAKTIEDVDYWATIYKEEGYNPETIAAMARAARNRIVGNNDTTPTGLGAIWEGIKQGAKNLLK